LRPQEGIRLYYEEQYRGKLRTGSGLKRVRSNLRGMDFADGDVVIDVGCGLGATGTYLADRGALAVGIDISFEAARATSQLGEYAAVVQANAESLPFAGPSFDGAVFLGTLEHFLDPARALREVTRVLKPGAHVCFVVPNSDFFLFRFLGGTGQPHESPRTYQEWRRLFEKEGFKIKAVYRDVGPSIFDSGSLVRGILRKFVLISANLLPLRYTYQFVFVFQSPSLGQEQ
jgi:SAM-dependent methyltransferase